MSTHPDIHNNNNKIASPLSLRLSFEERAALEKETGNKPLGTYTYRPASARKADNAGKSF